MIVTQGNIFLIVRIFTRKCVFVYEIFCTFCKNSEASPRYFSCQGLLDISLSIIL